MVIGCVSDVVYDILALILALFGPDKWVYLNSLKEYHGKPLRSWLVPGDHHNVATKTDATAVFSGHKDVPSSQDGW